MKKVRLTESQLHSIIKESARRVLSEMDWKTTDAAAGKSEEYDNSEEVLRALNVVKEYLEGFVSNHNGRTSTSGVGDTEWKSGDFPNHQANQLLMYVDKIRSFAERKGEQRWNLLKHADRNFEKQHDGQDRYTYERNIPDEWGDMDSKQTEYAKAKHM